MDFETIFLHEIERAERDTLDALPFGVIGIAADGTVATYNATESRLAGLSPDRVMGKHFFTAVAPCMNNFMVAQRMDDEPELDETIDYVLTLRMRPTPVRLRMLRSPDAVQRYILIRR